MILGGKVHMFPEHCLNPTVVMFHRDNLFLMDVVAPLAMSWDQLGLDMCSMLALTQGPDVKEEAQVNKWKEPADEVEDKVPLPLAMKEDLVDKVEGLVTLELQ
jgi:hypothetical protein